MLCGPGNAPADSDSLTAGSRQASAEAIAPRGKIISSMVSKFSRCGIGRSGAPVNSNSPGGVSTDVRDITSLGIMARGGPAKFPDPAALFSATLGEKLAAPLAPIADEAALAPALAAEAAPAGKLGTGRAFDSAMRIASHTKSCTTCECRK